MNSVFMEYYRFLVEFWTIVVVSVAIIGAMVIHLIRNWIVQFRSLKSQVQNLQVQIDALYSYNEIPYE